MYLMRNSTKTAVTNMTIKRKIDSEKLLGVEPIKFVCMYVPLVFQLPINETYSF